MVICYSFDGTCPQGTVEPDHSKTYTPRFSRNIDQLIKVPEDAEHSYPMVSSRRGLTIIFFLNNSYFQKSFPNCIDFLGKSFTCINSSHDNLLVNQN